MFFSLKNASAFLTLCKFFTRQLGGPVRKVGILTCFYLFSPDLLGICVGRYFCRI
ncbi:hypothetical protein HMPREF0262_03034 [Clostridium sp. ATCC 29733]|nr:hypothetical protein HMPREF0262_03034 [Clostridium sp. ATCC 29733]